MFQREVALRIVGRTASADDGRLSVLAQWRSRPELLFDIDRRAFTPPPKVTSSLVRIAPAKAPDGVSPKGIERLTAAAFGQRRKMLRSSLRTLLGGDPSPLLARIGIAPTDRAEDVPVEGYIRLAREIGERDPRAAI